MKLFKNKLCTLLLLLCSVFLFGLGACTTTDDGKGDKFTLTLTDEAFRPSLYIGEEYSIEDVIEEEEGATYSIKSLFYFDDDFKKVDITHADGKFTQSEPYDVILTVEGKKGNNTDDATLEMAINFTSVPTLDAIMEAWNDEGVIKSFSARSEHLKNGAKTALVTRYMGSLSGMDGCSWGNFTKALSSCSVTDWKNAVVTMDVYNDTDYAIYLGWQISKDQVDYQINIAKTEIPAKSWGKVEWSFRAVGYDQDYFSNGKGAFGLKASPADATQSAPFDFTWIVCNVDVQDYSAEKFPDLETRTQAEINQAKYDSLQGDDLDKAMVCFTTYSPNFDATTDTTVKTEGDSSVKYTFTPSAMHNYPNKNRGNLLEAMNGELTDYFTSLTSWKNVYASFYVKTDAKLNLKVCVQNSQDGKAFKGAPSMEFYGYVCHKDISPSADWQLVEFCLNDHYNLFKNNVSDYKLVLCNESVLDAGVESISFYIDDFKLESRASDEPDATATPDADDEVVLANSQKIYQRYPGTKTYQVPVDYALESLTKPTGLETSAVVKSVVSHTTEDFASIVQHITAIPESYTLEGEGVAHVGFWLYNKIGMEVTAWLVGDDASYPSLISPTPPSMAIPNGEWTWVEFSLENYNVSGEFSCYIVLTKWMTNLDNKTYYVDGLSFYNKVVESSGGDQGGSDPVADGDADDDAVMADAQSTYSRYPATTATQIVSYETAGISKPADLTTTALVKATVTFPDNDFASIVQRITSIPDGYVLTGEGVAHVGFWLYNATGVDLNVWLVTDEGSYANLIGGTPKTATNGAWTYIEYSLAEFDVSGSFNCYITVTMWSATPGTAVYYVDGLSYYNKVV